MARQRIRIRLKAFDHRILDQSAVHIVEAAESTGAAVVGPVPMPTRMTSASSVIYSSTKGFRSRLKTRLQSS